MNRQQEKLLVAALCGLVITAAAGFAVQPAMAGTPVHLPSPQTTMVSASAVLLAMPD